MVPQSLLAQPSPAGVNLAMVPPLAPDCTDWAFTLPLSGPDVTEVFITNHQVATGEKWGLDTLNVASLIQNTHMQVHTLPRMPPMSTLPQETESRFLVYITDDSNKNLPVIPPASVRSWGHIPILQ